MKLEVSFGGNIDYAAEAPFRMAASAVPRAPTGPYGVEHEVGLLATQSYRELAVRPGPVDTMTAAERSDLPTISMACAASPMMFAGADEVCAGRVESGDRAVLGGLALSHLLQAIHQRWERGEARDGLPRTWIFVQGTAPRWAMARAINEREIELTYVQSMVLGDVRRVTMAMPRRTLGKEATLAVEVPKPPAALAAADTKAKLDWYGNHTQFIVLALSGDADLLKKGSVNLAGLLDHLGPAKAAAGAEPWVTCTPRKGREAKHCEVRPRVEMHYGLCVAVAWALAAGVPHMPKPPWTAREEVTLALHCGEGEGHRVLAVKRKAGGKNRLDIETEISPPMVAPIDPSKAF